jgi:hypothetical protein
LQCSVVDCAKYANQLSAVEATLQDWQEARKDAVETLRYYNIPKSPIAVFKSQPKTAQTVVVRFDPVMVCDTTISRRPFWRIKLSFEMVEANKVPKVGRGQWAREQRGDK